MIKIEHNVETNEIKEITLSKTEADKIIAAQLEKAAAVVIEQATTEANATAKAALLAKLGITADEATLLLGGN